MASRAAATRNRPAHARPGPSIRTIIAMPIEPFQGAATLAGRVHCQSRIADGCELECATSTRSRKQVDVLHRGILPFRVWQFFERMKDYAATDPDKFIAAAGTLAHYVGDASQPLHGSTMSDGISSEEPDIPRDSQRKDKHGNKLPAFRGEGVHSVVRDTDDQHAAATKAPAVQGNSEKSRRRSWHEFGGGRARSRACYAHDCMRDVANICRRATLSMCMRRVSHRILRRIQRHCGTLWVPKLERSWR